LANATYRELSLREAFRPFLRRAGWVGLYFLLLFSGGMAGYVAIEGWGWFDGLYMAVTTVTSVGFMEVHPLSTGGRAFTMIVLVLGVTGLGLWWALITAFIIELDLGGILRRRRVMRKIGDLTNHFIICGAGRVGRVVIAQMLRAGSPFVVIERDPARVRALEEENPGLFIIEGDALREVRLEAARVATARGLAACLAEDADNLLLCLTARARNPGLTIVARARDMESEEKIRRAGADHVISPTATGGARMASVLLHPSVVSFLDVFTRGGELSLRLEEAPIPPTSKLVGQTLAEARIPQRTGLVVLALKHGEGPFTFNPGPETRLAAGDVMIVLGDEERLQTLRQYVSSEG
jgi:voltage-gated potassium channel